MGAVREQQELVAPEHRNLTAELLAGRQGPKVQFEGMRLSVKVEKPENYDGDKVKDLDTWFFQVREHLELSTVQIEDTSRMPRPCYAAM